MIFNFHNLIGSHLKPNDYSIPWHILDRSTLDFFVSIGLTLEPSGYTPTRPISHFDLCIILDKILRLNKFINDEDNHIAFAIGDCLVEIESRLGNQSIYAFMDRFTAAQEKRGSLLTLNGVALTVLRSLESSIELSLFPLHTFGGQKSAQEFFSANHKARNQTLGQMKKKIGIYSPFNKSFEKDLERCVFLRNEFIHKGFSDRITKDDATSPADVVDALLESHKNEKAKIIELLKLATNVEAVFRGLIVHLGMMLFPDKESYSETFRLWEHQIQNYLEVANVAFRPSSETDK